MYLVKSIERGNSDIDLCKLEHWLVYHVDFTTDPQVKIMSITASALRVSLSSAVFAEYVSS